MDEQPLLKKTLITVAAMLGAWVLVVGSISLVTVLVVGAASSTDASSTESSKVETERPTRASSGTKGPATGHTNHLMKSATQI